MCWAQDLTADRPVKVKPQLRAPLTSRPPQKKQNNKKQKKKSFIIYKWYSGLTLSTKGCAYWSKYHSVNTKVSIGIGSILFVAVSLPDFQQTTPTTSQLLSRVSKQELFYSLALPLSLWLWRTYNLTLFFTWKVSLLHCWVYNLYYIL